MVEWICLQLEPSYFYVEAPIIDKLRVLANMQRLYMHMNIFFLCAKKENMVNANTLRILFIVLNFL